MSRGGGSGGSSSSDGSGVGIQTSIYNQAT